MKFRFAPKSKLVFMMLHIPMLFVKGLALGMVAQFALLLVASSSAKPLSRRS
jgi:hypothetical protein